MKKFWQKLKELFVKGDGEKTALQKTAKVSIILGAVALIGVIVYFAAVAPMLRAQEEKIPELFDGEVYQYKSIFILPPYERTDIKSVEIHNKEDHYRLVAKEVNGKIIFKEEGYEDITLSENAVSALLGDVRMLITNSPAGQDRVNERATEEDLRNYGLSPDLDPAWFEVTLNDGSSYKIYVGNALSTSAGYYAILEGRKNTVTNADGSRTEYDIVYAMQSGLSATVLSSSTSLVAATLAPSYGSAIYNCTDFALTRRNTAGVREVIIRAGLVDEIAASVGSQTYKMIYPAAYRMNETVYTETVLAALASVSANQIVAYGPSIFTPEVYEKYGLDLDRGRLESSSDNNYAILLFNCANPESEDYAGLASVLYFSKRFTDVDGEEYYYVYAPAYEVIGKVTASTFDFVEWNIARFTNENMYYEYFTSTEYFEIVSLRDELDLRFTLSGKERHRHVDVTRSGDKGEIVYRELEDGTQIPLVYDVRYKTLASSIEYEGEFEIFRDLYYILITRTLALYANIDSEVTTAADMPSRYVRVKTLPKDHPMSYYQFDSNGKRGKLIRDQGGNILCTNVVVTTTLSDGTVQTLTYNTAYYDEGAGRFFLKSVDSNDDNEKPNGYTGDSEGLMQITTYLPVSTAGEYEETIYEYAIYDLYDEYTDADGNVRRQLNPTYSYIIPSTTTNRYRITSGGERELLSTKTETAQTGVYIRTATIDKLFSDTKKLLAGEEIDKMGVN